MSTISSFKLEGLVPATFTPMKANGDVYYDMIDAYCQYLVDHGITQVFVNGTTGEGFSLTIDERKKVAGKWIEIRNSSDKLKSVVIHVGALNLHDSQELARHAASIGADAIAAVPSLFFKPKTNAYLIQYCQDVAQAAPDVPFYFYHLPGWTGVETSIEDFLMEAETRVPSLVGVKFSSIDLADLLGAVNVKTSHRQEHRFNLVYGCDDQLVAGVVTGADGAVGSTYNFVPGLASRMFSNTRTGNLPEALEDQYRLQQTILIMRKYGRILGNDVASLKALMSIAVVDLGPARSPSRSPTATEMAEYRTDLEGIGFSDWHK